MIAQWVKCLLLKCNDDSLGPQNSCVSKVGLDACLQPSFTNTLEEELGSTNFILSFTGIAAHLGDVGT